MAGGTSALTDTILSKLANRKRISVRKIGGIPVQPWLRLVLAQAEASGCALSLATSRAGDYRARTLLFNLHGFGHLSSLRCGGFFDKID
jgi:hypothetical protein